MNQTIIGVFDTLEQAENAVVRLEGEGIARSDISLHRSDDSDGTAVSGAGTTRDVTIGHTGHAHEGAMARIEHFFKRLFGGDERPEEVGHYQEAVRRGGVLVSVEVENETAVERASSVLSAAGAVDIDRRVAQWRTAGYSGYDSSAPAYTDEQVAAERKAFPVVEETLDVGKREVSTGGVRAYSRVTQTPVSETVNLREERATVERRAADRPATAADLKEGVVEVRETAEEPVVAKTARVVEEVVVGKETSTRTETINDTVRNTDVEVERLEGTQRPTPADEARRKP
jgi:uncharacterized protein (TIGR02271 family)